LAPEGGSEALPVAMAPNAPVQLAGELATFEDLRAGDRGAIAHDSADKKNLSAQSLPATPPADAPNGLLVISNQTFDDATLGQFPNVKSDAEFLKNALIKRYGLSPDQANVLTDETRIRLEQAVPQALERLRSARQLIVYYAGAAFVDDTDEKK